MLAVGDLPGEVGNEQERVADPANGVIQNLGGGEGLVAALVGQHPHSGADKTLHNGVQGPKGHAGRQEGHGLRGDIVVEEVENRGQDSDVPEDIVQTSGSGAVEAVSGNGIADLLDGIVWDLELVSVGVQHLAGLLLRSHGGQGCRGGRLARAIERRGRNRAHSGGLCWEVTVERNALGDCGGRHIDGILGSHR